MYEIDNDIPEELNIMNLPLFLPPLKPLKMKQVELINPTTFDKVKNKIRSGSSSQSLEISTYNSHIIYLSYYIQFLYYYSLFPINLIWKIVVVTKVVLHLYFILFI